MKQTFTKLLSTAAMLTLLFNGLTANAQTVLASAGDNHKDVASKSEFALPALADKKADKPAEDTSFHPVRRIWGYTFGDFYYAQHAEAGAATTRGGETNYNGVPANRNAFQFRRIYLGYDYDINKKFSVELLLASEPSANTAAATGTTISNGDNLGDNKMSFYIKLINLRWKNVFNGTDFVIGQLSTPGFSAMSEKIWGYRSIEKTVADFHKTNSYDIGAALQGVFDPATKNFGYDVMIGDNTQASLLPATTGNGFFKAFYGDVYGKFLDKKLVVQLYADYMQTTRDAIVPGTPATVPPVPQENVGTQSHNMFKGFVAYTTPKLTVGVEAYTNNLKNAVTETTTTATTVTKVAGDATAQAISAFVKGAIYKDQLGFFARYDSYTPNSDFNKSSTVVTTVNASPISSYYAYAKERFITAGLDFMPSKNVHFMPNVWFIQYKDERAPTTAGYIPDNHTLVYRLTFFYTFGK